MKKGCIIVLVVLVVLLAGIGTVAGVALYKVDQQYGVLTEAPAISHETLALPETRLRALLRPEKLNDYIAAKLPMDKMDVPAGMPQKPDQILPYLMPREVALVSTTDYRTGKVLSTIFVNERRGGPFLVEQINSSGAMKRLDQLDIKLDWEPVVCKERGCMTAQISMDIPDGLEGRIVKDFPDKFEGEAVRIEGDHLLEVAIENRDGELEALMGTFADAMGDNWERFFKETAVGIVLNVLPNLYNIRLTADLNGFNEMKILLRASAQSNAGPNLAFLAQMGIPYLQKEIEKQGMKLEGKAEWVEEQEEFVADYTLTGFEPLIDEYIAKNI